MARKYHIIAVDADLTRTLALKTSSGWRLPRLIVDDRQKLVEEVRAAVHPLIGDCELVHIAIMSPEQSDRLPDWRCVVVMSGAEVPYRRAMTSLNSDLESTVSVDPRERRAWLDSLERLRAPVAPFDSLAQLDMALAWAREQISSCMGAQVLSTTKHRCNRYEFIARLETTAGRAYLKAGPERVHDEAVITCHLSALSPGCVPETLAIDRINDLWLYRELRGEPLLGANLSTAAAAEAVRVLARLQKRVLVGPQLKGHAAFREMNAVDLFTQADHLVRDAWGTNAALPNGIARLIDAWGACREPILDVCASIDDLQLPLTLVLSDFWPGNVLSTADGIGFIDVGRSVCSCPFLTLSRYIKHVEHMLQARGAARALIERTFVSEWAKEPSSADLTPAMPYLSLFNRLLALLVWSRRMDRQERDLATELPLWYRPTQLAPFVSSCIEECEQRGTFSHADRQ